MGLNAIWVVAEHHDGVPSATTLECVAAARSFGGAVSAVSYGLGASELANELGAHGVEHLFDLGDLGDSLVAPRTARSVAELVGLHQPDALFLSTTYDGRDVAARLSVLLDRPALTNVVGLEESADTLVYSHSVFGGTKTVRVRLSGGTPQLIVIRPKSFVAAATGGLSAVVEAVTPTESGSTDAARVVARHKSATAGPPLDGARVVVSGGRGLGNAAAYSLIERIAELLGGAPAASRALVDAGWVPYAYQVGQTGKIVTPEVYVACGISGATQHLVGMKGSKHIIAVNKDENAPIFSLCDLGVVGDVLQVLPKLISALEARG